MDLETGRRLRQRFPSPGYTSTGETICGFQQGLAAHGSHSLLESHMALLKQIMGVFFWAPKGPELWFIL